MNHDRVWLAGSLVLLLAAAAVPLVDAARTPTPGATMAAAANRFLATLPAPMKQQASFAIDDQHRLAWFYVPLARKGLALKSLNARQRTAALNFVQTGLSQTGYTKATQILALERVLAIIEKNPGRRDHELYFLSVFGVPTASGTWGWRFEGHHLSLNFMVVKGSMIATTPVFLGANPSEVLDGPHQGLRVLHAEEDDARAFVWALTDEQRKTAIIAHKAPSEILTRNQSKVEPLSPPGLPASALTQAQNTALRRLIDVYAATMPPALAQERMAKIDKAGWANVHFAWAGGLQPGEGHYYRISGPSFVVEYDNTQNQARHVHTVWRDFEGDFGRDLMREHYKTAHGLP